MQVREARAQALTNSSMSMRALFADPNWKRQTQSTPANARLAI
jgi:hypothetical protein